MLLDLDFWKFVAWCLFAVFGLIVIPLALALAGLRQLYRYITGPDK